MLASKTTLIPLDITHQLIAHAGISTSILRPPGGQEGGTQSTLRRLFNEILLFFSQTYSDQFGLPEGPPLHDPAAVLAALRPGLFDDQDGSRYAVLVSAAAAYGPEVPSTAPQPALSWTRGRTDARKLAQGEPGLRVPVAVQVDEFWRAIYAALASAEARVSTTESEPVRRP